jgi:hypothetical protein
MLAELQVEWRRAKVRGDRRPKVVQLHERHDERRALRSGARRVEHDQETTLEGPSRCGLLRFLRHGAPFLCGSSAAVGLERDWTRAIAEHTVHFGPAGTLILFAGIGESRRRRDRRRDLPYLVRCLDLELDDQLVLAVAHRGRAHDDAVALDLRPEHSRVDLAQRDAERNAPLARALADAQLSGVGVVR